MLDIAVTDKICKFFDMPAEKYDSFYNFCKIILKDKNQMEWEILKKYNNEGCRMKNSLINLFTDSDVEEKIKSIYIIIEKRKQIIKQIEYIKHMKNMNKREYVIEWIRYIQRIKNINRRLELLNLMNNAKKLRKELGLKQINIKNTKGVTKTLLFTGNSRVLEDGIIELLRNINTLKGAWKKDLNVPIMSINNLEDYLYKLAYILEKENQKDVYKIENIDSRYIQISYISDIISETFLAKESILDENSINLIIGYISINTSRVKLFHKFKELIRDNSNKELNPLSEKLQSSIKKEATIITDNKKLYHKPIKQFNNEKEMPLVNDKPKLDIQVQKVNSFKDRLNLVDKAELQYIDYLIELKPNKNSFMNAITQDFVRTLSKGLDEFIWKLKLYSYFIHCNFANEVKFLNLLKDSFKKRIISLKGNAILISVVIQDIWDVCTVDTSYNIDDRIELLKNISQKYFLQYIEKDPMYIQNIENPSFGLQKLAVIKNPNAIDFIKKPDDRLLLQIYKDKKFVDYVKQHQDKIDSIILMNVKSELAKFIENATNNNGVFMILNSDVAFDCYIKAIFDLYVVEKFYVATGYTFASGLQLLKKEFSELLADNGELCFIIGSLQHYPLTKNLIQGMDKQTAMALNDLLAKKCRLKTCTTNFYHGKMYYIQTRNFAITIMGSTNFSRTAFQRNKELDTLFYYKDNQQNPFFSWFDKFWTDCTEIKYLEESRFSDVVNPNAEIESNLETISIDEMKSKIAMLSNEELRERLSYWMNYNPSNIFDHVDIAGKDYIAIEYLSRKLIVLESFYEGNAYYAFRDSDIQEVLAIIKGKTKTEIGKLPKMAERGYHIQDIAKIKLKIKALFMQNPNR